MSSKTQILPSGDLFSPNSLIQVHLKFDTLHIRGVEANRKRAAINDARKKAEEAQAYLDSIPELDMSVSLDGVKV